MQATSVYKSVQCGVPFHSSSRIGFGKRPQITPDKCPCFPESAPISSHPLLFPPPFNHLQRTYSLTSHSRPAQYPRMATPAQVAANQANSQKSTGPTSPEGQARSSRNSFQHGLYSKDP